jgi:hypothetical protein
MEFGCKPELVKSALAGYVEPDAYPVDLRGVAYSFAFIGLKRLGAGQFYLVSIKDKTGQDFDGGRTYRLMVSADVPVKQYWSLTAYDRDTHALIRNIDRAIRSSQIADLQKNADGSVGLFVGPKAPDGKEANWIPTVSISLIKRSSLLVEVTFQILDARHDGFELGWCRKDHGRHSIVVDRQFLAHIGRRHQSETAGYRPIISMVRRAEHQFLVLPARFGKIEHGCGQLSVVWMRPYLVNIVIVARVSIEVGDLFFGILVCVSLLGHFRHGMKNEDLFPERPLGFDGHNIGHRKIGTGWHFGCDVGDNLPRLGWHRIRACPAFDAHRRLDVAAARIKDTPVSQHQNVERFLLPVEIVSEVEREMSHLSDLSLDRGDFLIE